MEKVAIEEFNCCHSFVQSCVNFFLPLEERKFVCSTHLVGRKFHIFISYNKENFKGKIDKFIADILYESHNWISKYWDVREPRVYKHENSEWEHFPHSVTITFLEKKEQQKNV